MKNPERTIILGMNKHIAVLAGDGIGPEVTKQSLKVLKAIAKKFGHNFEFKNGLIGAAAIDETGNPFPDETKKLCESSDAILFGAIGDPKYDNDPSAQIRPEQGLLAMRKTLGLYANVRPIKMPGTSVNSPLRPELIMGVDFVVVRELIGGAYFGEKGRIKGGAFDTIEYSKDQIERIARYSFDLARKRRKQLTLVDKANVLETSRLWRETVQAIAQNYEDVRVDYMFVDNAAMQLIRNPKSFDVILTENMFGDILTDEASVIVGSLGLLPSASVGGRVALYEPIHGSYPQAAGRDIANPIGSMLSVAMMLEDSFGMSAEAQAVRNSIETVLAQGFGTEDLESKNIVGTREFGQKVCEAIKTG